MKKIAFLIIAVVAMTLQVNAQKLYPSQDDNGKWGYVNDDDEWIIDPRYDDALYESDGGMYGVSMRGKWGMAGYHGEILVEIVYDEVQTCIDYTQYVYPYVLGAVRKGGKWAFVTIQGVPVTDFKYDEVRIHAGQYTFKIRQGDKEIRGHLDRNVKELVDEERTIERKTKKK